MKVPFSPPKIDQEIIDEVVDSLKSGWITTGPKTRAFESELVNYTGAEAVLCTNSATAGLELILRWFGVKEGDEVILPAYTYCATANVVLHCGAKPVMVDIGEDFNIDVSLLDDAITNKTKVIMPVDMGGFPCDYNAIHTLINQRKKDFVSNSPEQEKLGRILVLSDAAHSIGASYNGQMTGNCTDVTVFSFHAVKNLTTVEGGAICLRLPAPFNNNEIYQGLRIKALHGQSKDALSKTKVGGWDYDVADAGYKCNMPDICAAIGLVEIKRYDKETLSKRNRIFDSYSRLLSKYNWAELPIYISSEKQSSYHVYLLKLKRVSKEQRDQIMQYMFDAEVAVNIHFKPLPLLSLYKGLGYKMNDYPVAKDFYNREISLPVFYDLSNDQVELVVSTLKEAVESVL